MSEAKQDMEQEVPPAETEESGPTPAEIDAETPGKEEEGGEEEPMLGGAEGEGEEAKEPSKTEAALGGTGDKAEVDSNEQPNGGQTRIDFQIGGDDVFDPPVQMTTAEPTKPPSGGLLSWEVARKVLIGLAIGLSVAVSWVAATQFVKSTYSPTFDAPYFVIWFSTIWMAVCYPIYVIGAMVLFKERREAGLRALWQEDTLIYGENGMTVWSCLRLTGPFCALWMITNYMYFAALKFKAATEVTAIFVTNTAFIYVFSWIWLEELLILLPARLFSVLCSIGGTILMMSANGFNSGGVVGIFLALGSAIGAALYKVLFKRFVGDATYGQVSLFLTMLAILDLVFLWPIMLALYYTDKEVLDFQNLPWAFLCGSSALGIVFNFLVNFGIALTYPLLISLANIVGIPINAVIDTSFRNYDLGVVQIIGSVLIILGFLVMLLPETWQAKVACWKEDAVLPCGCRSDMERIPEYEAEAEAGRSEGRGGGGGGGGGREEEGENIASV